MDRKTQLILGGIILLVALIIAFGPADGADDWQYTAPPSDDGIITSVLVVAGLCALTWLGISIYLIIIGKRSSGQHRKRILGITILLAPVLLAGIAYALGTTHLATAIIATALLLLIGIIAGIIFAVKLDAKIAIIPILLVPAVIIGLSASVVMMQTGGSLQQKALSSGSPTADIGFSVGGAKDISNFRENIEQGYLPQPTDLTYEGLFYDYYFETGQQERCEELFCPSYSYAKSEDPLSGETDEYLSVGLNSGIQDFERKKLNLVVVLDISGSMGSGFNKYYYDDPEAEWDSRSKMEIARESVADMLGHLDGEDRFGMVLFNNEAYVAKPLREVGRTDMAAIEGHILEITQGGGTNMEAGLREGTKLFDGLPDDPEYENRIIFLTDAQPNTGATGANSLVGMARENAEEGLHTTFIGVGVDFNTALIEHLTKIRGANYYSIHSSEEFSQRMDEEFEYLVTPLVFDLELELDAEGYDILQVYGSPEANESTGELMRVNTLFPSAVEDGQTRGGVVLIKLDRTSQEQDMQLRVSYEDRSGEVHENTQSVVIPSVDAPHYDNEGTRKAILLSRYADTLLHWVTDTYEDRPATITVQTGIEVPAYREIQLGQWERQSQELKVSEEYEELLAEFKQHFDAEAQELEDETLEQESGLLEALLQT